jgi:hypothetical protein
MVWSLAFANYYILAGYWNARLHLRVSFSGWRRNGVLTMNAKYSTSGSDTWIVDVMDNDTVVTSAEADSEENTMAMARTSASAFYGSRAAMFDYGLSAVSHGSKIESDNYGSEGTSSRTQRTTGPRLRNGKRVGH